MAWSRSDEENYQKAKQKLQMSQIARTQHVTQLRTRISTVVHVSPDHLETIVDALINCADDIRDLLAPFDSGIRAAKATGE